MPHFIYPERGFEPANFCVLAEGFGRPTQSQETKQYVRVFRGCLSVSFTRNGIFGLTQVRHSQRSELAPQVK